MSVKTRRRTDLDWGLQRLRLRQVLGLELWVDGLRRSVDLGGLDHLLLLGDVVLGRLGHLLVVDGLLRQRRGDLSRGGHLLGHRRALLRHGRELLAAARRRERARGHRGGHQTPGRGRGGGLRGQGPGFGPHRRREVVRHHCANAQLFVMVR